MDSEAAMAIALFASVASVAWSAAFAYARWLGRPRELPPSTRETDRRLASLEQAIDAVAVEVERLSEAQRFTVRLLDQRLPATGNPALPPAEPPEAHARR